MATTDSDYLVRNDLKVLYELLEGECVEEDINFVLRLDSVMDEGEIKCKEMP